MGDPRSGRRSLSRWFNTLAVQQQAQFQFGNSPRSVLRGGALRRVDGTLNKEFAINEKYRAELRGEFYNLTNHANFNAPGHTLGAADFGVVSSARAARTVQLGARFSF